MGSSMSTTLASAAKVILLSATLLPSSCGDQPLTPLEAAKIQIAAGGERLPMSASNVWFHEDQYMDTTQDIRFDGPAKATREFAEDLLKKELIQDGAPHAADCCKDLDWWIKSVPEGAYSADSYIGGRSVEAVMIVKGNRARLWVHIFVMA